MKFSMAAMRSLTEVKLPRRIAWRVTIEKKISTMFSHDPDALTRVRLHVDLTILAQLASALVKTRA